jgi:hypothetical protein
MVPDEHTHGMPGRDQGSRQMPAREPPGAGD